MQIFCVIPQKGRLLVIDINGEGFQDKNATIKNKKTKKKTSVSFHMKKQVSSLQIKNSTQHCRKHLQSKKSANKHYYYSNNFFRATSAKCQRPHANVPEKWKNYSHMVKVGNEGNVGVKNLGW